MVTLAPLSTANLATSFPIPLEPPVTCVAIVTFYVTPKIIMEEWLLIYFREGLIQNKFYQEYFMLIAQLEFFQLLKTMSKPIMWGSKAPGDF